MSTPCPVCDGSSTRAFFALKSVPVICNQLWPDADAARAAPVGDVNLAICDDCAMVWNAAFEPARMEYAPGYENALHFSPSFRSFADELAARLVTEHDLDGRHVVEIGCGDGFMLDLMAAHGAATAVGFDPTMDGVASPYTARDGVEIVPEYFRSDQLDRHFDAVLCRHVLEHVDTPVPLLVDIRAAVGERDVPIYFEMPNAGWMLDAVSMWDVIYEHVGYWTAPAIETLYRRTGFAPTRIAAGYGEQFLMAEGRPIAPQSDFLPDPSQVIASANRFKTAAEAELSKWRDALADGSRRAVIWGAGSKGITFANALGDASASLTALVDLNPRKHDLFVPGVALPVCSPDALPGLDADLILISNALYQDEIKAQVRAMGLAPEFGIIAG